MQTLSVTSLDSNDIIGAKIISSYRLPDCNYGNITCSISWITNILIFFCNVLFLFMTRSRIHIKAYCFGINRDIY